MVHFLWQFCVADKKQLCAKDSLQHLVMECWRLSFFVHGFQEEWLQCHRIDQERSIRDDKKKLEQAKKRLSDLDVIISRLYEDYVLGNLSQDRYKKWLRTMKTSRNG